MMQEVCAPFGLDFRFLNPGFGSLVQGFRGLVLIDLIGTLLDVGEACDTRCIDLLRHRR